MHGKDSGNADEQPHTSGRTKSNKCDQHLNHHLGNFGVLLSKHQSHVSRPLTFSCFFCKDFSQSLLWVVDLLTLETLETLISEWP